MGHINYPITFTKLNKLIIRVGEGSSLRQAIYMVGHEIGHGLWAIFSPNPL